MAPLWRYSPDSSSLILRFIRFPDAIPATRIIRQADQAIHSYGPGTGNRIARNPAAYIQHPVQHFITKEPSRCPLALPMLRQVPRMPPATPGTVPATAPMSPLLMVSLSSLQHRYQQFLKKHINAADAALNISNEPARPVMLFSLYIILHVPGETAGC